MELAQPPAACISHLILKVYNLQPCHKIQSYSYTQRALTQSERMLTWDLLSGEILAVVACNQKHICFKCECFDHIAQEYIGRAVNYCRSVGKPLCCCGLKIVRLPHFGFPFPLATAIPMANAKIGNATQPASVERDQPTTSETPAIL
jgi:hypothetical protein